MEITTQWTMRKIKKLPEFRNVGKYFISSGGILTSLMELRKLEATRKMGWNPDSIVYGLNRLGELGKDGIVHYVYSPEEIKADKSKADVNILFFPPKRSLGRKEFVIVAAGGAYMNVCSMVEGYPVAARLNELGYSVFVLTYRTGGFGLMPKPLEDLAAALRYIRNQAQNFDIDPDRYLLCGFSAGANLISVWGLENLGYHSYGHPKPRAMFPVYPAINHTLYGETKMGEYFRKIMFGRKYTTEYASSFDVDTAMTGNYPPCYIVVCRDDQTVPPINSYRLHDALKNRQIPVFLEVGEHGGHGFGEGRGTSVEGWIDRAVLFAEGLEGTDEKINQHKINDTAAHSTEYMKSTS